jgi:hypothetical protein
MSWIEHEIEDLPPRKSAAQAAHRHMRAKPTICDGTGAGRVPAQVADASPLCRRDGREKGQPMAKQFDAGKAAKILALVLGSPSAGARSSARHMLIRMLGAHSIAGRDLLPHHYLDHGDAVLVERVNDLLHPLWTGDDDAAREQHRAFVERRLIRWRLGWSDLIERLRSGSSDATAWYWLLDGTGTAVVVTEEISVSILDQISYLIGQYVALDADQLTITTLWAAHTHLYPFYMCSPRLAVCGPMRRGRTP